MPDKIAMTERDKYAVRQLAQCTFLPGSYNKRFARNIHCIAQSETPELTEKQLANLWRLVYRYRHQIEDKALIREAELKIKEISQ